MIAPPPSPLQFGACDLGFSFLGSGGGADECGLFDQRSLKMSGDLSDEEDVIKMTKDDRFENENVEPEVIVHLPRGSDPAPELVPSATPMEPGAVSVEADTPDPGLHHRVEPLSGAKPKQFMFEMTTLPTPGHGRPPPRAGTLPVADRFIEMQTVTTPGHGRPPPRVRTQPVTNQSETPTLPTLVHNQLLLRTETQQVTDQLMHELPTLPTSVHSRELLKTETQPVACNGPTWWTP